MSNWFATVDLDDAPPATQRLFTEICRLLDRLQPANLAVDRQTAEFKDGEISVQLVHCSEPDANLDITFLDGTTFISGLSSLDEDYSVASEPAGTWETDTIDTLTGLLQGSYLIETQRWQGRRYRTLTTDLVGDARAHTRIDSILGLLPLPHRALQITNHEIDYGCVSPETGATSNRQPGAK